MNERSDPTFSIDFEGKRSTDLPINLSQTSILPVVFIQGDKMRSVGTCFSISNHGLCMTAKHVIEDIPTTGSLNDEGHLLVDGTLGALYISPDPPEDGSSDLMGGFIPMSTATSLDELDIALMHLQLPVHTDTGEYLPFPLQRLKLDFPRQGDRLIAFGYEKGEWTFNEGGVHTLSQTFTAATGFASEVFPQGRDRSFMSPCFQTSVPFEGGMSGGPVISEDGQVIGVISKGFKLLGDEEPISYAVPIAPSMGISLRGVGANGEQSKLFLWDFAEGGAIKVDRGNARVTRNGQSLLIEVAHGRYHTTLGQ